REKYFCATRGWGPRILRDRLLAGWDLPCAVDNSKHVDLIGLDVVDDSEGPFQNLPNLRDPEFRDPSPRQGEVSNLLRAPGQAINNVQGVLRRIPCNVGVNGLEMVAGSVRPVDFHFLRPNPARTVSTQVVRPA